MCVWVVCVCGGGGGAGGGRAVRPLSCSLSHFVGSFRLFASQPLTSQYCSATGAAQRVVVDVGCEVGAGVGEVLAQGGLVPVTLQVRPGGAQVGMMKPSCSTLRPQRSCQVAIQSQGGACMAGRGCLPPTDMPARALDMPPTPLKKNGSPPSRRPGRLQGKQNRGRGWEVGIGVGSMG